ncbi:hypothetical protein [Sphingorhabdus sp. Alg239-R122]|uniref:hypothetical protein n=1 Tax=Sphingorhabdus sp. Alg239-R122 TaxID=2305989 RepID=UPI0013DD731A|nr:hypothetical protein [Sphingorhabdus sp. Alg239-R122]
MPDTALLRLIKAELVEAVDPRISDFAAAIAADYGDAARSVLFYGSCLRSQQLEGQMLDFYLIVSDYDAAFPDSWKARANRLLPPNVFPAQHNGLVAKYAVLSEADFHRLNRQEASAVSVWARFAQPSRLVWQSDAIAAEQAVLAISGATPTLLNAALAHTSVEQMSMLDLWEKGFALTYSAELRAERSDRSASVVEFSPQRYSEFGHAALPLTSIRNTRDGDNVTLLPGQRAAIMAERRRWPGLRRRGKLLTLARLAKATGTYAGGIDYIAWKINRHAGTDIEVKDWQRRWPILGAIVMLPRLILRGAIK